MAGWTQAAPTVSADSALVGSGATFTIDIRITDAAALTNGQFSLAFDPARLQVIAVTEGPFLSPAGLTLFIPGFIDNGSGLVSGVADAFVDLAPPSGVFLNLADSGFSTANGAMCIGGRSLTDCVPQPPVVPGPFTLVLAAMALGTAGSRRWRRPSV